MTIGKLEQLEVVARRLPQGATENCCVEDDEHSGSTPSDNLSRQLLIGGAGRVPGTLEEPCLELRGCVLIDTMTLELIGDQSPGATRGPLRSYASSIYPFVDRLRRDAIPCRDLSDRQPLGLFACSIADVSPPDTGKTKRL